MSILDAKDPQSWKIGFEDGLRFGAKIVADLERTKSTECEHVWDITEYLLSLPMQHSCVKCDKKEIV